MLGVGGAKKASPERPLLIWKIIGENSFPTVRDDRRLSVVTLPHESNIHRKIYTQPLFSLWPCWIPVFGQFGKFKNSPAAEGRVRILNLYNPQCGVTQPRWPWEATLGRSVQNEHSNRIWQNNVSTPRPLPRFVAHIFCRKCKHYLKLFWLWESFLDVILMEIWWKLGASVMVHIHWRTATPHLKWDFNQIAFKNPSFLLHGSSPK